VAYLLILRRAGVRLRGNGWPSRARRWSSLTDGRKADGLRWADYLGQLPINAWDALARIRDHAS